MAQGLIDGFEVEIELTCELRFEVAGFQFNDDIAMELGVIEEEVEVEVPVADFERDLATEVGEACTEFDEELGDVVGELILKVSFVVLLGEGEEVEDVGVF